MIDVNGKFIIQKPSVLDKVNDRFLSLLLSHPMMYNIIAPKTPISNHETIIASSLTQCKFSNVTPGAARTYVKKPNITIPDKI
jgi:hypothetical protein